MSGGILRFPWTTQPQSPVGIDPYWLARGLVFLSLGNGRFWTKNKGWGGAVTLVASPARAAGQYGLGTAFSGSNRMDAPAITTSTGFRSIVASYKPTTAGGGNLGRVFQDLGGSIANEAVFINTSAICYYAAHGSGTDGQWTAGTAFTANSWQTFGLTHDQTATGKTPSFYIDGASSGVTVNSDTTGTYAATSYTPTIGNRSSDSARGFNGDIGPIAIFDHPVSGLTAAEHKTLYANIWQLLAPVERKIWVPNAGGGSHPSSGALASSAASIAGTATHLTLHTTSGALAASDATIAGSANRSTTHPTSGALVASDAVIAGAATHLTLHTSSGGLVAGDAALAGAADHSAPGAHATSGALTADVAVIAGSAAHLALHTSAGALVADSASIAGTALHTPIHAASGGLVASEGALLGIALRTPAPTAHDATGGLVAGAAEIAGLATGPALPFFSVSGGGIKPKHHKKPTPSLFDEELKAPTAKLKKAVVPSFTPSTFVPYAKMGVPKALSKALGEVLVGPLSAPLREVLPPEYDDDDIPDEVIMLALQ